VVRVAAVIPAFNEAASLPALLTELAAVVPDLPVIIVDDGSTDGTRDAADRFGVRRISFRARLGVGNAVRAGLRYARSLGFDTVVRMDADGQHPPSAIAGLLRALHGPGVDAVCGARVRGAGGYRTPIIRRLLQLGFGTVLSLLVRRKITDPTSGFWAFGPVALELLAEHHPSGYPEPEVIMLLDRNRLRAIEVPVEMRARVAGRSSLTIGRTILSMARVLLTTIVVPLRPIQVEVHTD
jgi:glycosyltransferase involved in cell wall biosynthesis